MPNAELEVEGEPQVEVESLAERPFQALMVVEGRWTGDERYIMVDGLSWDGILPMALTIDHAGIREVIGRIDEIERVMGATADERWIFGRGVVIPALNECATEAERLIESRAANGVSIGLDAETEGGVDPDDPKADEMMWPFVVESARLRALSLVTVSAFAEAYITFEELDTVGLPPAIDGPAVLPADELPEPDDEGDDEVIIIGATVTPITAAGHTITLPDRAPAWWFDEPVDVAIEGALTITDEGRVYGLVAPSGTAFLGRPDVASVPMGNVDYSRFHRGEYVCADGARVVTGNITMGCGHSDTETMSSMAANEHHDNTCSVFAQVRTGERYAKPRGVWVAGAVLPGVSADQMARAMACQLSGEWWPAGAGVEMLNALLVPFPAFSMGRQRPSVTYRDGVMVASAVPVRFAEGDCGCGEFSVSDERYETLERRTRALESIVAALALDSQALDALRASLA